MNEQANGAGDLAKAKEETLLCFGTAGVCTVVGALGWGVNLLFGTHYPLPALMVVGALYGMMGGASLLKEARIRRANRVNLEVILSTTANSKPSEKTLGTNKDG